MITRIFDTAMEPDDIERATDLFRTKVRPTFESFDGCRGIEMLFGIDEHSRDLIDVAALSHWDSIADIERATDSPEYEEALAELRELFQQAPLVRHFEQID